MIFVFDITTPANTPATAKLVTSLPLAAGKIDHCELHFPPGVNALAHIQITGGLHQYFPTNPDGNFSSGQETIAWDEDITLAPGGTILTAYTWNDDTSWDHTITVRIHVIPASLLAVVADQIAALLSG